MDRAEKIGLGVAVVGHVALFGAAVGRLPRDAQPGQARRASRSTSALVDDVALERDRAAAAPSRRRSRSRPTPARPRMPRRRPAEAAPAPEPEPAPPRRSPSPRRRRTAQAAPPKPAAAPPKPAPKPAPAKPQPAPSRRQAGQAAPQARADQAPAASAPRAGQAAQAVDQGQRRDRRGQAARPRGSRLGADFLKGLSRRAVAEQVATRRAARRSSAQAAADIGSAIARQVQPCADRQVNPGPGAERIRVDAPPAAQPRRHARRRARDRSARPASTTRTAAMSSASPTSAIATFIGLRAADGLARRSVRRAARLEQFHPALQAARLRMR